MHSIKSPEQNTYQFEMSTYYSKAWQLFKAEMGPLLGVSLLILIGTIILGMIPFLGNLSSLLSTLLFSGFYIYLRNSESGQQSGNDFFGGFKFAVQIILFQLIIFVLIVPLAMFVLSGVISTDLLMSFLSGEITPYEFEEYLDGIRLTNITLISLLIIGIGSIYISLVFTFTIPLIVDGHLNFWNAMETSRKTVQKQFFSFLLFYLLLGLLMIITTIISCGLGLFFWIPFIYVVQYVMYDEIFIERV